MKLSDQAVTQLMVALSFTMPVHAVAEHEAHVHGTAELALAMEGNGLELMLRSPAINLVGFEHRATTPEQLQAVARTEMVLGNPDAMFILEGGNCALEAAEVDVSEVIRSRGNQASSDHDSHEMYEKETAHINITAHYRYTCIDVSDLKSLRLRSGKMPFSVEEIRVMWVSDRGQGAAVLDAKTQQIEMN